MEKIDASKDGKDHVQFIILSKIKVEKKRRKLENIPVLHRMMLNSLVISHSYLVVAFRLALNCN